MPKPVKKQRWSNIDVFGLLRGLGIWDPQYQALQYVRKPFDSGLDVRDRILRLNDHKASLTKQGLLNGLCAEFGFRPHNLTKKNVFQLTRSPIPSGDVGIQDIWVYFREAGASGEWTELQPQLWGETYLQGKENSQGFIVWPEENYTTVSGIKTFTYSTMLEILEELGDNQQIKIIYYTAYTDENNNRKLIRFTDMNNLSDSNDSRFLYREPVEISPLSGIIVYNLTDIPSNLTDRYYNTNGHGTEQLYRIKKHFDKMYKHTWGTLADRTTIWDIGSVYGSGEIPHFFDSYVPKNDNQCLDVTGYFSGYLGGIDYLSNALYISELVEMETDSQEWYPRIYPGRFYIDGIPYRLFEDPVMTGLVFVDGEANIPAGLERGMYTVLAKSSYYEQGCCSVDEFLSGFVYEDYWAPLGEGGDQVWSDVYRRRPRLTAAQGYQLDLELGQYSIDFDAGKIRLNSIFTSGTLIWDRAIVPSGRILQYDLNPLNLTNLNLQKFFIYLVNRQG